MRKLEFAMSLLLAFGAVGCSSDEPGGNGVDDERQPIILSRGEMQVAHAGYDFAWNLFEKLDAEKAGENLCLSPVSANIALTMLLNGADGQTRDEIVDVLGLDGMTVEEINTNSRFLATKLTGCDKKATEHIANSLWIDEQMPVKEAYKAAMAANFDAMVANTNAGNFASDVNSWCSKHTGGMISELVKPGQSHSWALLNAFYFKNVWAKDVKFKPAGVKPFNDFDGSRSDADFMAGDIKCQYNETELAKYAHVSFGNGAYAMAIVLPDEGVSLQQCISELKDGETFAERYAVDLNLTMPKFEVAGEYSLADALQALGMNQAFSANDADFPNISEIPTYVNILKQGCRFKIDEKGVTAAAVTIVGGTLAAPPTFHPGPMVVDRPFVYAIYETSTGCILFAGKIEKF